jgi:hypothetical protein
MVPQPDERWKHYGTGMECDIIYSNNVQMKDGGTRWIEAVVYQEFKNGQQFIYVRSMRSFLQAFEKIGG